MAQYSMKFKLQVTRTFVLFFLLFLVASNVYSQEIKRIKITHNGGSDYSLGHLFLFNGATEYITDYSSTILAGSNDFTFDYTVSKKKDGHGHIENLVRQGTSRNQKYWDGTNQNSTTWWSSGTSAANRYVEVDFGVGGQAVTDIILTAWVQHGFSDRIYNQTIEIYDGSNSLIHTYDLSASMYSSSGKYIFHITTDESEININSVKASLPDTSWNANGGAKAVYTLNDLTPAPDTTAPTLSSVSIVSNNATPTESTPGNVVTLAFTADEAITTPVVTFQSGGAAITDTSVVYTNTSGNIWTAAYTTDVSDTLGAVTYSIAFSDVSPANNAGDAVISGTGSVTTTGAIPSNSAFNTAISNCLAEQPVTGECTTYGALSGYGTMPNWDTSLVTDMSYAFYYSGSAIFNADVSSWDTRAVTNMHKLFAGNDSFNQDLSSWDTSQVTDMSLMFERTLAFNGDVSSWETANVTTMQRLFWACNNFNQDIRGWDTSNVTNMNAMLQMTALNYDIRSWDVDLVTDFSYMFSSASNMNSNYGAPATPTAAWFTPDTTAPTIAITSTDVSDGDTSNNATVALTFTTSEATTDFAVGDITVTNGALSSFVASSSTVYTATFTPTVDGATTINVAGGTFTDVASTANTAAPQFNWTFDGTAPTLSNVRIGSSNSAPTTANIDDVVTVTLTADETIQTPVVTFLSGGASITDTSVVYANTSGNVWTASYTVNASDTFGSVTYSIAFSDASGNTATAVTSGSGSVSFMPTPSAAFAAVKADVESKMASNARTQLNNFASSTSSIVSSARNRFMNKGDITDDSDIALSGDVSTVESDLKGSTKRIITSSDSTEIKIIDAQFSYTKTKEGLESHSASGQIVWEEKRSDKLTIGSFLGVTTSDASSVGTNNIDIDSTGLQIGAYLVRNIKNGLVLDAYVAGSFVENKMGVTTELMTANSSYLSKMLTSGVSMTGTMDVKQFEVRPTLSVDLSHMFEQTANFNVAVGSDTSVEQASYSAISKLQVTFAPEFRLPINLGGAYWEESSVITAIPHVKCRYLKQSTTSVDCGQGLLLGFKANSKHDLHSLTAKAGMERIGSETTTTYKLKFEAKF